MGKRRYAELPFDKNGGDGAENEFIASLRDLKKEDIGTMEKKNFKARSKKAVSIIQYVLMALCSVVFVICLYLIADNLYDKYKGGKIYDSAANMISPVTVGSTSSMTPGSPILDPYEMIDNEYENGSAANNNYNLDLTSIRASLSSLKQVNSDVIGWIYVDNTRINYPLLQSASGDSEYYLTHAYTGEYLSVGSIYMVPECDKDLSKNRNSLIYGHNIANGTMFHDVLSFDDPEIFNNSLIYIYTLEKAFIYKPLSIYETTSDYNYIQTFFSSDSEFVSFTNRVKGNSLVPNDQTVSKEDHLLTLSTCVNGGVGTPGRWALHAMLIGIVE